MSESSIFAPLHQGKSNRFACGALNAVAHYPGDIYNPLWIYGPSGTGKTALLDAASKALRSHTSKPQILHIHIEQLLRDMLCAMEHNHAKDFHARILGYQVIIVDHLDDLSSMTFTQEHIGLLLAKAAHQGSQVILSSTCPPTRLEALEQKLAACCPWLLYCDVLVPEPEERLDIIRHMARARNLSLSDQMTGRIAGAARTPARIRCIIDYLAARRELLQAEDADLSNALDQLLEQEVPA